MKTTEHRIRSSHLHKGKTVSPETRQKISKNSRRQTHRFSRCRGGFREDLQHYFRSSWEANYARFLNYKGLNWEYEAETFILDDVLTYTLDFSLLLNNLLK